MGKTITPMTTSTIESESDIVNRTALTSAIFDLTEATSVMNLPAELGLSLDGIIRDFVGMLAVSETKIVPTTGLPSKFSMALLKTLVNCPLCVARSTADLPAVTDSIMATIYAYTASKIGDFKVQKSILELLHERDFSRALHNAILYTLLSSDCSPVKLAYYDNGPRYMALLAICQEIAGTRLEISESDEELFIRAHSKSGTINENDTEEAFLFLSSLRDLDTRFFSTQAYALFMELIGRVATRTAQGEAEPKEKAN